MLGLRLGLRCLGAPARCLGAPERGGLVVSESGERDCSPMWVGGRESPYGSSNEGTVIRQADQRTLSERLSLPTVAAQQHLSGTPPAAHHSPS